MSKKNFVSYGDSETLISEIKSKLDSKQNALTFDNVPTANSNNPVKSGGVYSADEAIRKWTTAEAKSVSGNPITLLDGSARKAEGLSVVCNPKQNLHGYDHPWAGGAGKNKLPMTVDGIKALNVVGTWSGNTYTVRGVSYQILTDEAGNVTGVEATGAASDGVATITLDVTPDLDSDTSYVLNGCPTNGGENTYNIQYSNMRTYAYEDSGNGVNIQKFDYSTYPNAQIAIRVVRGYTIPSGGITFYPMLRLASESDATFEPYTNECPITGYTQVGVLGCGKNLIDSSSGVLGQYTSDPTVLRWGYKPITLGAGTYMVTYIKEASFDLYLVYTDTWESTTLTPTGTSFTLTENKEVFVRSALGSGNTESQFLNVFSNVQLEKSNQATTYSPYTKSTATIAFGQTVYGGSVDFKTGKVTVTHGFVLCDDLSFSLNDTYKVAYAKIVGKKPGYSNVISSAYKTHGTHYANMLNGEIAGISDGYFINIKNDTFVDVSDVETKLSGVQVCYELATPTELTLTPAELELLKGYNYISTNGTTIALDYLPDSLLAEAENYVDDAVDELHTNFQAGVDAVYDAVVAKGSTPASHSLSDVIVAIAAIPTGVTPSGTKSITANGTGIDVTEYANVDVAVPNSNSDTYTYPSGSTGGTVDLGVNNAYRYVNAGNVYAKGKADGGSGKVTPSYAYIADTAGQYNAWRYDNLYTFSAEVGAIYALAMGGTGSNSSGLSGSGFTQLGWYRNANAGIAVFKATSGTVSVGRNGDWPYNNNGFVLVKIANAS